MTLLEELADAVLLHASIVLAAIQLLFPVELACLGVREIMLRFDGHGHYRFGSPLKEVLLWK
jgi:hypothetical protein